MSFWFFMLIGFVANIVWGAWRTRRATDEFERLFGAKPGWKYYAIPMWKAGFAAPEGQDPTPEMETWLTKRNLSNWMIGFVHIGSLWAMVGLWQIYLLLYP